MIGEPVPKLVESFPGVLRDTVPRLAVINNCKVEGIMNKGVSVSETNSFAEGAKALSICVIR